MRLTMVGTGYVGLVTGVCLASKGNEVVCLDVDEAKVAKLRKGESPIYEPGLSDLLARNIAAGRIRFTTDPAEAHADADMIFLCVGTPSDERGHTDLSQINTSADAIARVLAGRGPADKPVVVVVKSTVPVGTTQLVADRIRARVGDDCPVSFGNNPEFLKEGDAIHDFEKPDRVVCGVENERVAQRFNELYEPFVRNGHPIFTMDIPSSEMVKYASNNFLATKISFINEMANLCEAYGADITRVRAGMCSDSRIGSQFLYPGLGYGGSCFPKDTLACMMMGDTSGTPTPLSRAVHEVNQRQREVFFKKILGHFGGEARLQDKKLAFWGLAFKPRTDDVREAPALTLIRKALGCGCSVSGYDPVAAANARAEIGPRLTICDDLYETARDADAVVISTDWDEFKSPDFDRLLGTMRSPTVFDGRNLYKPESMAEQGFAYYSVGRAPARAK